MSRTVRRYAFMLKRGKSYKKMEERKKDKREAEEKEDKGKDKNKRDVIAQRDSVYPSQLLLPSPSPFACPWLR
jgi:flagellar biosynthesis chaperone FliJ